MIVNSDISNAIGVCWMEEDGTIKLHLMANGNGGPNGSGLLSYSADSKHYIEILKHVGPLKPGQRKPVFPWTD